jgi:hypothetical protein
VTPFRRILQQAVEMTPGAVGGAFADSQGELVDGYAKQHAPDDWAMLTAHYGVIMAHMQAAFGIWHYGGVDSFIATHRSMGIVVHAVDGGYYALLAITDPSAPCQRLERTTNSPRGSAWTDRAAQALATLRDCVGELKKEMA